MRSFEREINETQEWFDSPRFAGIVRPYTARQVVEQRGTIGHDYTIAREAAAAFYDRLRELFAERKSITTFGPYSPGQAVAMKRMGIEAIYLGGWATSAKGGMSEDPGPDLASYPAQPGARRSSDARARPALGGSQPAVSAFADD
jgi:Isocitrate lyase